MDVEILYQNNWIQIRQMLYLSKKPYYIFLTSDPPMAIYCVWQRLLYLPNIEPLILLPLYRAMDEWGG
jgi:hypothetical protein